MTFDFVNYQFKPKRKDTPPYGHLIILFFSKKNKISRRFLFVSFFSRQGSEFFLYVEQQKETFFFKKNKKTRALCLSTIFVFMCRLN